MSTVCASRSTQPVASSSSSSSSLSLGLPTGDSFAALVELVSVEEWGVFAAEHVSPENLVEVAVAASR